ncbi:MAG: dephospho-CoA kinase [Bacteroidetes bacterium GWF2_43_63]|nr:MAG: dephospho-CoA kinase [Bacteroidetes bacterium GWE2_42_42]OFY53600.1 MAG: dephospho-CoA kinase [Bacteroidetes bacterium GWF2_43_63]HBG71067.1 dephospho-CoA kinase [Bacteroidales bacterium]HCB63645.1 dephospho-CoA kinase [Bacteroidales bacterium]HCY24394.1 dephospho-CoA kinase [Bacteroidales bacterium]
MIKIGLTGNLGSGKSTVAKVFETFGFRILDADAMAKQLYLIPDIRKQVESLLHVSIVKADNTINYQIIADYYFNKPGIYSALNKILYPELQKNIEAEITAQKDNVIVEAAMLYEINMQPLFDYVITVSTPMEERMQRVYKRNGSSREQFMEREKLQSPAEWKETQADFIVRNDERSSVIAQVNNIIKSLK